MKSEKHEKIINKTPTKYILDSYVIDLSAIFVPNQPTRRNSAQDD